MSTSHTLGKLLQSVINTSRQRYSVVSPVHSKLDKWNGVGFAEERHCRILYDDVITVDGTSEFRILLIDKPLEGSFYPLQVFPQSNVLFHSGHISGLFFPLSLTHRSIRLFRRTLGFR